MHDDEDLALLERQAEQQARAAAYSLIKECARVLDIRGFQLYAKKIHEHEDTLVEVVIRVCERVEMVVSSYDYEDERQAINFSQSINWLEDLVTCLRDGNEERAEWLRKMIERQATH